MIRLAIACFCALTFTTEGLRAQSGHCPQSGGDKTAKACGDCTESIGAGMTLLSDCSGNCQVGENCPDCCFECEAFVTFTGDPLNRLLVVEQLGASPPNTNSDSTPPLFVVQINVNLTCKPNGGEGTTTCVKFMAEHNGRGGSDPWERAIHCYRLVCDPCR